MPVKLNQKTQDKLQSKSKMCKINKKKDKLKMSKKMMMKNNKKMIKPSNKDLNSDDQQDAQCQQKIMNQLCQEKSMKVTQLMCKLII